MAQSPSHRFGQIIGDVLENAVLPLLEQFADTHGLYLDKKGARPCRRNRKCSWIDFHGNAHDLDFVMERGGSANSVGVPAAFIETAWRRYTKHSRNKVQEIQGAIEPLATTYRTSNPFKGAILAGVFTKGALTQLSSLGFKILYFPYTSVVSAFREFGIDAEFDESTPDAEFRGKVDAYERLSALNKTRLAASLLKSRAADVEHFIQSLLVVVSRQVARIIVTALHGRPRKLTTVDAAIAFVEKYRDDGRGKPLDRFEIHVLYNNGDHIRGEFGDKRSAVEFLEMYRPIPRIVP